MNISSTSNPTPPVRVGIAGLGRSGWNIHANAFEGLPQLFTVTAVADPDTERCHEAAARFGCRTYPRVEPMFENPDVELIVVASPSHEHPAHTIAALNAGKHVVCEKPMAASLRDADDMIDAARRNQRLLTIFHNRRFEPHVAELRRIIDSGTLGRIVHVRAAVHQFTRRWDWQTLQQYDGGMLNNIASHVLDLMLELFPLRQPQVIAHTQRVLTLGDAEDHCVLMLKPREGPLLYLEITNAGAYPQDLWLILGTRGSLRGDPLQLDWKVADFDRLPPRQLEPQTTAERRYQRDQITWQEHQWTCPPGQNINHHTHRRFYQDLYEALSQGRQPAVSAEGVRQLVAVLEQCRQQCATPTVPPALTPQVRPDLTPAAIGSLIVK